MTLITYIWDASVNGAVHGSLEVLNGVVAIATELEAQGPVGGKHRQPNQLHSEINTWKVTNIQRQKIYRLQRFLALKLPRPLGRSECYCRHSKRSGHSNNGYGQAVEPVPKEKGHVLLYYISV
jgi:hypothetical protein